MNKIYIYDTTLRDGAQSEGVSFSVEDKLKIVQKLDSFGVHYIEAGNPGSNPKDLEFFSKVRKYSLKNAVLTAFGSTRRAGINVEQDANLLSLLKAHTKAVAIFGKSWDFHVTGILRTTLEENLSMISDTISFLKCKGKEVIFDAEHFFDGYKANEPYAMSTLQAAVDAGADWIVLCDTNGGYLPSEIGKIVKKVTTVFRVPVGIHCHEDSGMAVANSLSAVENGAIQVHGTINGIGERCGNANLCTIIPNLQFKLNKNCISMENMGELTGLSRYLSELANLQHDEHSPYVGNSAFAHKGGMHIDAVLKDPTSFEHVSPENFGNVRRVLMSEVSGRSTILTRIQREAPWMTKNSPEAQEIIFQLKKQEHEGYQYEGSEGSFALLIKRSLGKGQIFFTVKDFRILCEQKSEGYYNTLAMVKVDVNGIEKITAAEGDGPVNAIDIALRKSLEVFFPSLKRVRLTDYKVRVLSSTDATAAKVRVHIESTDGINVWGTVGVSTNIIEASWIALIDSIEYFLYQDVEGKENLQETQDL